MSRNINREEAIRIAAEKVRAKKEKEEREDREFYERITSGNPWLFFKIVVGFCTLMAVLTTIETLFDGQHKKFTDKDWSTNKEWEWTWHKIIDVQNYTFSPGLIEWNDRIEGSMKVIYTPIFHTGKKMQFKFKRHDTFIQEATVMRDQSVFTWFPYFQIALLIPLATLLFKRQSPWFNFARIASFAFVLPGTILVIIFNLLS